MNRILILFLLCGTFLYGLEPIKQASVPLTPGTYLLVTQSEINQGVWSIANGDSIEIKYDDSQKLVISEKGQESAIISEEGGSFTLTRKIKGAEGIWITSYIGSLESGDPIVYRGHFVGISKQERFTATDKGVFMLIKQASPKPGK